MDIVREKVRQLQEDGSNTIELGKCLQIDERQTLYLGECHHRFIACMIVGTKTCVMETMDISRLGQGDIDFILPQCRRELMKVKPSFQPDEFTWPIHWSALHYDAVLRGAHNAMTTISHTPPPPPPMTLRHHSNDGADQQTVMVQDDQTVMVQDHQTSIIIIIIIFVIIIIKCCNKMTVKKSNNIRRYRKSNLDIENQIPVHP